MVFTVSSFIYFTIMDRSISIHRVIHNLNLFFPIYETMATINILKGIFKERFKEIYKINSHEKNPFLKKIFTSFHKIFNAATSDSFNNQHSSFLFDNNNNSNSLEFNVVRK